MNPYMIRHCRRKPMIVTLMAFVLLTGCTKTEVIEDEKIEEKETQTHNAENKDPYGLSFSDNTYHFENELRNMLSTSQLEYCSHIQKFDEYNRILLTWNLKSNDKEVYRCDYTYDKNRKYGKPSMASCKVGVAYEEYLNGDKALIRDYVMPEKDDGIDMFVYPKSTEYYDRYFILGKYSDMYCYTKDDDIYFEYYWYQDTDNGPKLVYKSTAVNYDTTSGQRYNDELWVLFEDSYSNIKIIPYNKYPRDKDYYEVYSQWDKKQREEKKEERLKEKKERYCVFEDGEELYYEYEYEFDSYEDAEDFLNTYCD